MVESELGSTETHHTWQHIHIHTEKISILQTQLS